MWYNVPANWILMWCKQGFIPGNLGSQQGDNMPEFFAFEGQRALSTCSTSEVRQFNFIRSTSFSNSGQKLEKKEPLLISEIDKIIEMQEVFMKTFSAHSK